MTSLTFVQPDGAERTLDVPDGWSLMQAATANGVDGILGECGGSCACATCHCYVDEAVAARLPAPQAMELDMLENVADERRAGSRLGCQVKVGPALAGARVVLPQRQE